MRSSPTSFQSAIPPEVGANRLFPLRVRGAFGGNIHRHEAGRGQAARRRDRRRGAGRLRDRLGGARRVVEGHPGRAIGHGTLCDTTRHCRVLERQTFAVESRTDNRVDGRQVGALDLVATLDQDVGQVLFSRRILNSPVCTAARIRSSVKAATRRAAQNASSSRISMYATDGVCGRHFLGSKTLPSNLPTSGCST